MVFANIEYLFLLLLLVPIYCMVHNEAEKD